MSGFLLDTNVPSELTKPFPQASVFEWLEKADDDQLYISVVTLGEVLKGVNILPEGRRRNELQSWLDTTLRPWFAGRKSPVTEAIAERWGLRSADCRMKGKDLKIADGFIAATAMEHDLILVTRNIKDYTGLGLRLIDPWKSA